MLDKNVILIEQFYEIPIPLLNVLPPPPHILEEIINHLKEFGKVSVLVKVSK